MFDDVKNRIKAAGILPVVKVEKSSDALNIAKALLAGGISAIEITFRTLNGEEGYKKISECIKAVRKNFPQMLVGAGTVLNADLAKKAIDSGASFIVSPGYNPQTVDFCLQNDFPVFPGVDNPSQVEVAMEKNLDVLKFFPSEVSGGVSMLRALHGPFPTMQFIATGGINPQNLGDYMKCKNVLAVCASYIVEEKLIRAKDWMEITNRANDAVSLMLGFAFDRIEMGFADSESAADFERDLSLFSILNPEKLTVAENSKDEKFMVLKTNNVERALTYLDNLGISAVRDTVKMSGDLIHSVVLKKKISGMTVKLERY